ncbi:hypothetical protein [Streptacidiphilus anmyonensis]|nr:hypothetical protein [Streptacidiphilus anmyonensis]
MPNSGINEPDQDGYDDLAMVDDDPDAEPDWSDEEFLDDLDAVLTDE